LGRRRLGVGWICGNPPKKKNRDEHEQTETNFHSK
jgi:hypothetical protein